MPGVPRKLVEHRLNVDPKFKPVKQYLHRFNEERHKAIGKELARLLAAGFIIEVFHPEWLANPVLVLKKNGSWRMCIDYTDLNKACPADPFALPILTRSLTPRRVVRGYVSWMHILVIIRSRWR
jgi:hypothetical protein